MMEAEATYFLEELRKVSNALTARTTVYMFGGGVLALKNLKVRTKDLDLVVRGLASSDRLLRAFESVGYTRRQRLAGAYRKMHASAVLDNLEGFRIDLFADIICRALEYTPTMQARAVPFELGVGLLDLRLAALEDVFILKSVTDRPRDVDDMARLARLGLDWKAVQDEMLRRRRTGGKFFMPAFVLSLEELEENHNIPVPILPKMREEVEQDLDGIQALTRRMKAEVEEMRARRSGVKK